MSASSSIYSGGVTTLEELADKYQRLLQEFSKTKAQHAILKKAVQNEQINNAKLLDELKTKELELRQQSQELDTLNFHNVGLTRKVSTLQTSNSKGSGLNWLSNSSKKIVQDLQVQLDAATLDLENKIQENEDLYRALDENQTNHLLALKEAQHTNEELEVNIARLKEKYDLSEKQHKDSMNTILQQKEAIKTEIKQVVTTLESLQPKGDNPTVLLSSQDVDDLFDFQATIRLQTKLLTDLDVVNSKAESCAQILKELLDKEMLNAIVDGIEKLTQCTKLIQEVTEKRNAHLTATLKVDLAKLSHKAKDCFRKIEFCLGQIRTHLIGMGNSPTFWICSTPPNLATFKPLHEILHALVQLLSTGLAQIRLEAPSETHTIPFDQLVAVTQACTAHLQNNLDRDSFTLLHTFHVKVMLTVTQIQSQLGVQSQRSEYLLQTMNAQLTGLLLSLRLNLDPLFSNLNRWLLLALSVDQKTYAALTRRRPDPQKLKLDSRSDKFVRSLRRQFAPTSIPYTESLHLLTANLNHKEEKLDFLAKLDQEKEMTRRKDHLISKFQSQLTEAENKLEQNQNHLTELETKHRLTLQELEDERDKQLEAKPDKGVSNGTNLPNGVKGTSAPNENSGTLIDLADPSPTNGHLVNRLSPLPIPTAAMFAESSEPSEPKPSAHLNGTFTNYLSNEEHYVEKLFKNRYETKLRTLTEQAELKDSQLTRLLYLTQQQYQLIAKKEREREAVLLQNQALVKELDLLKGKQANGKVDPNHLDP